MVFLVRVFLVPPPRTPSSRPRDIFVVHNWSSLSSSIARYTRLSSSLNQIKSKTKVRSEK
jgi:hypothetical protein